ncbi:MAG: hypothetical protein V8R51_01270 [Clostridia bacterium]
MYKINRRNGIKNADTTSFFKEIIIKQYGVDITNKIIEGYTRKKTCNIKSEYNKSNNKRNKKQIR